MDVMNQPKLTPAQLATMRATLHSIDPEKRGTLLERLNASLRRVGVARPSDALFSTCLNNAVRGLLPPVMGED